MASEPNATVNIYTRAELHELGMLLSNADGDVAKQVNEWRQRMQRTPRGNVHDPTDTVQCSICGSQYSQRNPGQHFRTKRHLRVASSSGEYCSLQCTFRQRRERVTSPPTPAAPPKDRQLVIYCNNQELVCRACGGSIRQWASDDDDECAGGMME